MNKMLVFMIGLNVFGMNNGVVPVLFIPRVAMPQVVLCKIETVNTSDVLL